MKILMFILSVFGFFITGYSIVTQFLSGLDSFGEWLFLSILIMLFIMCTLGAMLNYEGFKLRDNRVRLR